MKKSAGSKIVTKSKNAAVVTTTVSKTKKKPKRVGSIDKEFMARQKSF